MEQMNNIYDLQQQNVVELFSKKSSIKDVRQFSNFFQIIFLHTENHLNSAAGPWLLFATSQSKSFYKHKDFNDIRQSRHETSNAYSLDVQQKSGFPSNCPQMSHANKDIAQNFSQWSVYAKPLNNLGRKAQLFCGKTLSRYLFFYCVCFSKLIKCFREIVNSV